MQAFLRKDDDPDYAECSDRVLAHFLDGLVIYCRGRNDSLPPRPVEKRITNNVVLKKLRVAFELKDVDMHEVFEAAGFPGLQAGTDARCSASPGTRTTAPAATRCCATSSRA